MAKKIKTILGSDGYEYPITSYELVLDENGESLKDKLQNINTGNNGNIDLTGYATQEYVDANEPAKVLSESEIITISANDLQSIFNTETPVEARAIAEDYYQTVINYTLTNYKNKEITIEFMNNVKKYIPKKQDGQDIYIISEECNDYTIYIIFGVDENDEPNPSKAIIMIYYFNEDTSLITDCVIKEKETRKLNNDFLENNVTIANSLTIGTTNLTDEEKGELSFSQGKNNIASGDYSHAEGLNTTASNTASHAEGYGTTSSGDYSHAEGLNTTASNTASHAEGNNTTASNYNTHAEGCYTTASGHSSHAEGKNTNANGNYSHAEGNYTKASSECQHVQGKYNVEDSANKYAHIVGNGTSEATRSNAHTLDWSGNAWYQGKLSQDGIPVEDKDLVTKKYVDDNKVTKTSELTNDSNFVDETYVTNAINNAQLGGSETEVDLTIYQTKTDNTLNTTDKTIVGSINEIKDAVDTIEVPTKTSDLTNDSGFITSIPSEYVTETELNSKGYLTEHQSLDGYAKTTDIPTNVSQLTNDSNYTTKKYVDDNLPHYNETLMFEISGVTDYSSFYNNSYFNTNALNLDEAKQYIGEEGFNDTGEKYTYEFVYDKEADALINEHSSVYIYNHKSYNGTDFIEDTNSAVLTFAIKPMGVGEEEVNGYFRLYEIDKVELNNNCLSNDVSIKNSLTVGTRIGDIGSYSVAEGDYIIASGYASHAEGDNTEANGASSHAEGNNTTASGRASHAEGNGVEASGVSSHAEGMMTISSGGVSHAEGRSTVSSGIVSHAEGDFTIASSDYQHVQGKYNVADTSNKYAHIVGNGTANDARSNAHTLDWNGNAWYQGKLSQDGIPTEDKDLITKSYFDTNKPSKTSELTNDSNFTTKQYVDDESLNVLQKIYNGKVYKIQLTEDEMNGMWSLNEEEYITINNITQDDINNIMEGDIYYSALLINDYIFIIQGGGNSNGVNGITCYSRYESSSYGYIEYYNYKIGTLTTDNNTVVIKKIKTEKYDYNTKIINKAIINNKLTLDTNKNQYVFDIVDGTEIVLPTVTDYTEIHLYFDATENLTLTYPSNIIWQQGEPTITSGRTYELIFTYTNKWVCGYVEYGADDVEEATDEEINAMLLEIFGGDYSN